MFFRFFLSRYIILFTQTLNARAVPTETPHRLHANSTSPSSFYLTCNSEQSTSILSSFLPSFFPTSLPSFLPSFMPLFLPSSLPLFLPSFLPLSSFLPLFLPSFHLSSNTEQNCNCKNQTTNFPHMQPLTSPSPSPTHSTLPQNLLPISCIT